MNRLARHLLTVSVAACLVVPVTATSANADSSHAKTFSLVKNCTHFTGAPFPDSSCEITSSTLGLLPVGSTILYVEPGLLTTPAGSDIVVVLPGRQHRSKAYGNCSLDPSTFAGRCTLDGGTGRFSRFHARVVVSNIDNVNFGWTGTYFFGPERDD